MRTHVSLSIGLMLAVGLANGATYSVLGNWQAAVTGASLIDFNAVPLQTVNPPNTLTTGGVTFSSPPEPFWVYDHTGYAPSGSGRYLRTFYNVSTAPPHDLFATLSATNITAFALDLWAISGTQTTGPAATIKVYDVSNPSVVSSTHTISSTPVAPPNTISAAFFGYTSTNAIAKVEIIMTTSNAYDLGIDNFRLAQALNEPPPNVDTPETPTLGYFGIGVVAMLCGSRKKFIRRQRQ